MLSPHCARSRLLALMFAAGLSAAAPAGAGAAANNCQGAPGTSAVEQYCEAILSADGARQRPAAPRRAAASPAATAPLPAALRRAGDDGEAIARLLPAGTLRERPARAGREPGGGSAAAGADTPRDAGGSALSAARHAVQAGPTVGAGLTWSLLGATGLLSAGALLTRRRSGIPAS
jgi:hypothetical protein